MSTSVRKNECVPYVHGFKVPKKSDIDKALGKFDNNNLNSIFNEELYKTFDNLPLPKSNSDWLAQYKEKGQTYMEFVQLCRTLNTPLSSHRKIIYLTVFGQIDKTIFDIDYLIDYTQRFFQMDVKLINPFIDVQWNNQNKQWTCKMNLNNNKIGEFNLDTRYNEKTKHSQIYVISILNLLKKILPNDGRCVVALTTYDLFSNDTDLFISGLSMINYRVAVFSIFRYNPYLIFNQSYWFKWKLNYNSQIIEKQKIYLLRSCRLLTHEISHLFGIDHCIYYSCLMNGSGHIEEDFSQPLIECPIDLRKLNILIKFDILKRYQQLLEFYQIHNFINEIKIIEIKLNIIKNPISNSTTLRKTEKRKYNKDHIENPIRIKQDKQLSKSSQKHFKSN